MFPRFFNFTDRMNFLELTLFFVGCFLVYILLGVLVLGKIWKPEFREKNNDIVAGFSVILGIIFAVIVGSVIVAAWGYQDIADKVSTTEADAVGDLFQMAPNTGLVESQRIKPVLIAYAENVIEVEWPLMRKSIKPVSGWNYLIEIQNIITNLVPSNVKESILLNNMQTKMSELLDARRKRIQSSLNNIPFVIYTLIFFISAFLIFFTFFFGISPWTHILFCTSLAILISLCIVVIIALDCPFRTQIRIDPIEMERVLKLIKSKDTNLL